MTIKLPSGFLNHLTADPVVCSSETGWHVGGDFDVKWIKDEITGRRVFLKCDFGKHALSA